MEELAVRDREYYIENADCVIRVDNTIFKVRDYNFPVLFCYGIALQPSLWRPWCRADIDANLDAHLPLDVRY